MQEPKPKTSSFAVLLASYNGAAYIVEQIESILAQAAVRVHIFVRDDGSSDDTIDAIMMMQAAHPEQISVLSDSLGPTGSAAANFFAMLGVIDLSPFDYIGFADQDDVWLPDKLKRAEDCLSGQEGGGYSSNLLAWDDDTDTYWPIIKHGKPKKFDYLFQGASAGCTYVLDTPSALLVQQRMAQFGRQSWGGVSHDWAIYAICRSAGMRWFHDTHWFIHYRQHSNNVYGARPGLAGIVARFRMISNGWYRDHILWLEHVITNRPDERRLFTKLKRGGLADRIYLAAHARDFRRDSADVWKLRIALILGFLGHKSR